MVKRTELVEYLDELLGVREIDDHSVNGLQVEGAAKVGKVALVTDAALALYRRAAEEGCQMIVAHHGIVWGGLRAITGRDREHVKFLLDNDLNLYAAHLPLDAHPEVGNNAELARMVGLVEPQPFGAYHGVAIGLSGGLPAPRALDDLVATWTAEIGGEPLVLRFGPDEVRSVGIVSGGGSYALSEAVAKGLDCLVTGESDHRDHHLALEAGINVVYLGHYHSETVGVRALGRHLEQRFGLETVFLDEPTLV